MTRTVRLVPRSLGARLAVAFAAVAIGTAVAVAVATPPIVGRGFAAMQAAQASGAPSTGNGLGPGHGMGPGAGLGGGPGIFLAQAQQETTTTIIVVAVLAAAIASLLGVLMARRIAKPLQQLEGTATAVAHGDLAARSGLSGRADELGSLGRSFDAMAADLERNDASRRRFFQDAAHEMKTPLAVIEATAAAVMDGVYEHDDRHLATIRSQARLLGRVIDDLRTISLAEAGALPLRLESVSLADVLPSIGSAFAARADASGVSLSTAHAEVVPLVVTADRERLGQAIAALVDNAIRFAPSGGHVLIRGMFSPRSASLARVEVLDDGPGVPADDMAHVFDRFYQADPSRDRGSGTSGLGLAITRAIVEAHEGSTGVENPAEGGARFWIDMPLVRPV
jgi:two-component system, OmpR family, sensor histidine kinase BaeS